MHNHPLVALALARATVRDGRAIADRRRYVAGARERPGHRPDEPVTWHDRIAAIARLAGLVRTSR
jgi:hypothetical protein